MARCRKKVGTRPCRAHALKGKAYCMFHTKGKKFKKRK